MKDDQINAQKNISAHYKYAMFFSTYVKFDEWEIRRMRRAVM